MKLIRKWPTVVRIWTRLCSSTGTDGLLTVWSTRSIARRAASSTGCGRSCEAYGRSAAILAGMLAKNWSLWAARLGTTTAVTVPSTSTIAV